MTDGVVLIGLLVALAAYAWGRLAELDRTLGPGLKRNRQQPVDQ
jgi:hypothetical protein